MGSDDMAVHISLSFYLIALFLTGPTPSLGESTTTTTTKAPPQAQPAFANWFGGEKPTPKAAVDGEEKNETGKEHESSAFFVKPGCPICPCQIPMSPFFPPVFAPGAFGPFNGNPNFFLSPEFWRQGGFPFPISSAPKRSRRQADYWHSLGPTNNFLASSDLGYLAQQQMRDQFAKYGPALHMGMIDAADFNYPTDFNKFSDQGYMEIRVDQNVVYELTGPLEVVPNGNLIGPIVDTLDTFTTITLRAGFYRLVSVQKNGIMKIADTTTNTVFAADCTKQRKGRCQNLEPVRNPRDFPKFSPKLNQIYILTGMLDVTTTANPAPNTQPTTLFSNTGEYQIIGIQSRNMFTLRQSSTNVVFFVDCTRQVNGRCESLKPRP